VAKILFMTYNQSVMSVDFFRLGKYVKQSILRECALPVGMPETKLMPRNAVLPV
jgi:hypothetical protein